MQSTIPDALKSISPGLTFYGVLVTFAVASFAAARFFWGHEKELVAENFDRVKDLLGGFRRRSVEPIIAARLEAAISSAYDSAILGIIEDLSDREITESGSVKYVFAAPERVNAALSHASLEERLSRLKSGARRQAETTLASDEGEKLFDDVDHAYGQATKLRKDYQEACRACARTCYAFMVLSILMLGALVRLIATLGEPILWVWLVVSAEVLCYGLYSLVRVEVHKRRLLRLWEEFQLYGRV
jgi:hypothetical protein